MPSSSKSISMNDDKFEKVRRFFNIESPSQLVNAAFDYIIQKEGLDGNVRE